MTLTSEPRPVSGRPARTGDASGTTTPVLEVHHLAKSYGEGPTASSVLADIDFTVRPGEFVSIVGPSGCGKTTLLKCLSGLLDPSSGSVVFEGEEIDGPPAKMTVVFQDYSRSLLPWMTVEQNIDLPLRRKFSKEERARFVAEALENVGLAGTGAKYPWQMSGGMQQRAAIARALAYQPDVLLMDEPFAAVDAQTRIDLEDLMLTVQEKYDTTVVFVTHDIDEAIYVASRVIVLSGTPTTVREVLDVDLPRPRDQIETKALPRFNELRAHLFRLIKEAKRA
ncbi:ABC transporter ATP-binding protein [Georgenia thermotolerans]|uniref:ATP-binding cassette domain-containing protein n=1 Tax=Georgenia thermotolerans TaxID=527326 RepID=A0A7J5UTK9_9MICO|nr:ABC transporter ATP-binding protein [Georgenia thermotolerans]KAE8765612.1 ATP-binding cassette domain-containing protein [Georgenia thermotolerans]